MDGEANLPAPPAPANDLRQAIPKSYPSRPFTSSSSPPDFLRHVQAAFKRHRPLGTMQSSSIGPRRVFVHRREQSKNSACDSGLTMETEKSQDPILSRQAKTVRESIQQSKSVVAVAGETLDGSSITLPSVTGTITKNYDDNPNPFGVKSDQTNPVVDGKRTEVVSSSGIVSQHVSVMDQHKKVHFSLDSNSNSQRADDQMATKMDDLSSHMGSLALTEMEWDVSTRAEISAVSNHDAKHRDHLNTEASDVTSRSDGGISSLLERRSALLQDQQQQFAAFIRTDISHPMTQSSVIGLSCATTTSVHSTSAPMLTTNSSRSHRDNTIHMEVETLEENVNPQPKSLGDRLQASYPTFECTSSTSADKSLVPTLGSISALDTPLKVKDAGQSERQQCCGLNERDRLGNPHFDNPNHSSCFDEKSDKRDGLSGVSGGVLPKAPPATNSLSVKLEPSKSEKAEKPVSGKGQSMPRKKNYDPDLFFKVNGKLYQRLGKIGSGGSSEVHKVISSDCTIYALKKIKLKGRDYSTAYGFCQEIDYLNKLKGMNNIIQLIDYEVTEKTLLQEVMSGSISMNNKDARIKDDGYIYMVLEYGEIDLAHMLSQKWKDMNSSDWTIDENWLRFYWQQILQAVNTIHEERIVHSDLKPANFLLVKGSLKLIDFGIAKAIMSDTTNIQRDSQVGTLSYMSPEAFMCNENDANGNTIKCGRSSDIWSLGCILYQMVYGRTPFAEYKTFWAKFKVITDRNHEITYGPVSNPWLLDLMKKCLAWDRNERWRIPQLLQHPFLVPPIASQVSSSQDDNCKLLQLMTEAYRNDREVSMLCSQLQQLLTNPVSLATSPMSASRNKHCNLLLQISRLCCELQQHLTNLGREG